MRDLYADRNTWDIEDGLVSTDEIDAAAVRRATFKMNPSDARWVLAIRVAHALDSLQGGALAPERREKLIRLATNMGLRSFDANLIIAIVQDAARTSPLAKISTPAAALHTEQVMDRLAMVPPAGAFASNAKSEGRAILVQASIALLVGVAICVALATFFFG
ncbi:MAG: hypothetical protein AAGK04_13110 [Planctomycetota bacterium]